MYIIDIKLHNFRNYRELSLSPARGVNVLIGSNAQGKTNLLEAVYLCATARSRRARSSGQMIAFGEERAFARVAVDNNGLTDRVSINLANGKKGVMVNGAAVAKLGDLFGALYAVLFAPEDLGLVKSGPAERRRFMDLELCQLSPVYYYDLSNYCKSLAQRNNLLRDARVRGRADDALGVWDDTLSDLGERIVKKRAEFAETLAETAARIHSRVTGGRESLRIVYRPSVRPGLFADALRENRSRDISRGMTCSGAHKDDLAFVINGRDARLYGSQGQQRTAALSVKLSEALIILEEKGVSPVLLLDDVFSELDESRREQLLDYTSGLQTFITAADASDVSRETAKSGARIYRVENGTISGAGPPGFF
ncbi:MAG: DNA replication/repair protein RecF [Clostridiales bacterium]|jgi:DNA replication and repair protein RecF|nr:DNA replication/repair protein RecF [Clostridiales bacterium]